MQSVCFCQPDLRPLGLSLTRRREAPLSFLLCIHPHNLLKATIGSLLSVTTVGAVIYARSRAALWVTLGGRNGHFTPTILQLLFSSAPCMTNWTPVLPRPSTALWAISCEILPRLKQKQGVLHHAVCFICCYDETGGGHSGKAFRACEPHSVM